MSAPPAPAPLPALARTFTAAAEGYLAAVEAYRTAERLLAEHLSDERLYLVAPTLYGHSRPTPATDRVAEDEREYRRQAGKTFCDIDRAQALIRPAGDALAEAFAAAGIGGDPLKLVHETVEMLTPARPLTPDPDRVRGNWPATKAAILTAAAEVAPPLPPAIQRYHAEVDTRWNRPMQLAVARAEKSDRPFWDLLGTSLRLHACHQRDIDNNNRLVEAGYDPPAFDPVRWKALAVGVGANPDDADTQEGRERITVAALAARVRPSVVSAAPPLPPAPFAPAGTAASGTTRGKGEPTADARPKPKRQRGRNPVDPKQTKRIRDAWDTEAYKTVADLARELRIDPVEVRLALDRSRKKSKS